MKKDISITIITDLLEDIDEFNVIRKELREIIGEYFQYESNFVGEITYGITAHIPIYNIEKIGIILKDLRESALIYKMDNIHIK